jgi:hypothetical protein
VIFVFVDSIVFVFASARSSGNRTSWKVASFLNVVVVVVGVSSGALRGRPRRRGARFLRGRLLRRVLR